MNKGNLNKLVTNYPVELTPEEVENLSATLAPVVAACGGGGGTGGKIYTGTDFVNVNNSTNQIGLTEAAKTKLNQDIPTKVSDLSDSANYQTVAGMDEYLTKGAAQDTYLTKSDAENGYAPIGTYTDVQTLKNQIQNVYTKSETSASNELSAEFDSLSAKYQEKGSYASQQSVQTLTLQVQNKQDKLTFGYDENNAISSIDGTELAGQCGTTYSAGAGIAIVDEYISLSADYIQAITQVSGKQDKLEFTYDNSGSIIKINNSAIAGGGSISYTGRNGVDINGNYIELETTAKNAIDSVCDISTDVGTLKTASANWNKVSDKLDTTAFSTVSGNFLTAHQSLDDYATKTDISDMATKTWVGKQGFYTKASGDNDYAPKSVTATINTLTGASAGWNEVTAKLDKFIYSNASGNWENTYNVVKQYSAAGTWLTAHQSLTNYYTKNETSGASELSTEFAKYVTSSSNTITGTKQYALTTTGWAEVQAGSTFIGVTTDVTLTGTGIDSSHKLGVAWSELSSNKIDSAKSAEYITNGIGYSGFNDISAKFDSLTSYVPYSATVLPIGTNNTATNNSIAIGASNTADDLGFAVGQSNTALKRSLAFGVNNYANDISLAIGYQNSASGRNDNNQSAVNIAIGYANSAADHAAAFINVCTAENYAFAAGHGNSAVDNSVAFGRNTSAYFYSFDFGHSNDVRYYSYAFGRGLHYEGQWANGSQYGAFVIGGWNATTSYATTADAPLFIIGNGSNNNPSDGFIVYRDGRVWVQGAITSNGGTFTNETIFSAATGTFDNSYIKCINNHSDGYYARFGVGSYGGAVIKVGDTNGTSPIQVNIKPTANNYELVKVERNNSTVGYLIPAVTSTTTAGLTDDGILHIIIES